MSANIAIDKIISTFDFAKVQRVMEFLDWGYFYSATPPSIEALQKVARECLEKVAGGRFVASSTGGFTARRSHNDEEGTFYTLTFSVHEQSECADFDTA